MAGFTTGCGTGIEDALLWCKVECGCDVLCSGILYRYVAVDESGELINITRGIEKDRLFKLLNGSSCNISLFESFDVIIAVRMLLVHA